MAPKNESSHISNNLIAVVFLVLLGAVLLVNITLYKNSADASGIPRIQGATTGLVRLCINTPPIIRNNCSTYANVSSVYTCNINATDSDGHALSFFDNSTIYNITSQGIISLTPTQAQIGQELSRIVASDSSSCTNANASKNISITVCMEPIWDNFKNNLTTNLSAQPCWNNISDFRIGKVGTAKISFTDYVSIDGYNFDLNLNMSHNYVNINTGVLSNLLRNATLEIQNLSSPNVTIRRNGIICYSPDCQIVSYSSGTLAFSVLALGGVYDAVDLALLNISDDTNNHVRYVKESTYIYANFSYSNGTPANSGGCTLRFNISNNLTDYYSMSFNSVTKLFNYNRSFNKPGNYSFYVNCTTSEGFSTSSTDVLTITNRKPILIENLPNETWNQNTILTGRDLDDYFVDPDNDNLTFTHTFVPRITVFIDPDSHVITLTPDPTFAGNVSVVYRAYDEFSERHDSNIVSLLVIQVAGEPTPDQQGAATSGGGGGGGGGGGAAACTEKWECEEWGPCFASNIQTRECKQLAKDCNTKLNMPPLSQPCSYFPTCSDYVRNGEEIGVDCGGIVCKPCATCSDGIQNQGEEGVDCGGLCQRCPSCFDGFKNGWENGIDCGGICKSCPTCNDRTQNQHEDGIDCGGECNPCESCNDKIRNQNEQGVDCGGPCNPCELPVLFAPTRSSWTWITLIVILALIITYVMNRRGIHKIVAKAGQTLTSRSQKAPDEAHYRAAFVDFIEKVGILQMKIHQLEPSEILESARHQIMSFICTIADMSYTDSVQAVTQGMEKLGVEKKTTAGITLLMKKIDDAKFTSSDYSQNSILGIFSLAKVVAKDAVESRIALLAGNSALNNLLDTIERQIQEGDIKTASVTYKAALGAYNSATNSQKNACYDRIKNLALELNSKSQDARRK